VVILDVSDIVVNYGVVKAVRGVSFDLLKGEVATIIGANGAGKTTILKAIMGIIKVAKGSIKTSFFGAIQHLPPHKIAKQGISYVPEGREILASLSVEDNLAIGGYTVKNKKQFTQRIEYVFEKFPVLKERRRQLGSNLSGGEQQMLAIARGLMSLPQILLLDEPSLGLAPIIVSHVFSLISHFQEEGYSILLIEQNAKKALQISKRGYVLEDGMITMTDSSENLVTNEDVRKAYLGG
jgi:branched-chain amino acid transport system ATP-binding protein